MHDRHDGTERAQDGHQDMRHGAAAPYRMLAVNAGIHLVLMFLIMYVMIASRSHFHANINRFYMALLMVLPMVVTMPLTMRTMFANRRRNAMLIGGAVLLFAAVLALVRSQAMVGNTAFLRSMIPHHSSAVLMCRQAAITDAEIHDLCAKIVRAQLDEIAQMERILGRL